MGRFARYAALLIALLVLVPCVSAFGYGTSSISVTQSSVTANPGTSASVGYNVTIASGSTWGSALVINNKASLSSHGIAITDSNAGQMENPPYSGTLAITVSSSTFPGLYQVILSEAGDDPSAANTTFYVDVPPPPVSTTTVTGAPTTSQTTITLTTIAAPTTSVSYPQAGSGAGTPTILEALMVITLIGMVIAMMMRTMTPSRLIILSVALILLGTLVWLYGDYTGGNLMFVWGGVAAILLGTIIWVVVDHQAHLV